MPREDVEPGSPADWLRYARSDLTVAEQTYPPDVLLEALCFHAQQAAEKAVKAVLIRHDIEPPYTHDIARLVTSVKQLGVAWPPELDGAVELTRYAAETRYPGAEGLVREEHYREAVRIARAVVEWAEDVTV